MYATYHKHYIEWGSSLLLDQLYVEDLDDGKTAWGGFPFWRGWLHMENHTSHTWMGWQDHDEVLWEEDLAAFSSFSLFWAHPQMEIEIALVSFSSHVHLISSYPCLQRNPLCSTNNFEWVTTKLYQCHIFILPLDMFVYRENTSGKWGIKFPLYMYTTRVCCITIL